MYDKEKQAALDELVARISDFVETYLAQGTKIKFTSLMGFIETPPTQLFKEVAHTSAQIFCEKCDRYVDLDFESNYCRLCGGSLESYFRDPSAGLMGVGNYIEKVQ